MTALNELVEFTWNVPFYPSRLCVLYTTLPFQESVRYISI